MHGRFEASYVRLVQQNHQGFRECYNFNDEIKEPSFKIQDSSWFSVDLCISHLDTQTVVSAFKSLAAFDALQYSVSLSTTVLTCTS